MGTVVNVITRGMAGVTFALSLIASIPAAFADVINMDTLARRDLSPSLVEVVSFASPCDGAFRFVLNSQQLIVDCGGSLPLGREPHDPMNLNAIGTDFLPGEQRAVHVYDVASGALQRSFIYTGASDLTALANYLGNGSWLAGAEPPSTGPQVFLFYGSPATRAPLRRIRSQFIAAQRIDENHVALVYEAWVSRDRNSGFPEPFVAMVDITTGDVVSDAALRWESGRQSDVTTAAIDPSGVTLFYRRLDAPSQQSDFYVAGGNSGQIFRQRFGLDGVSQAEPVAEDFDAANIFNAGDLRLLRSTELNACPNAIAAVLDAAAVRHCFQRSAPQRRDYLQRQRPTQSEQYSYYAQFMNRGELVVISGMPGVDEIARNPSASITTHLFETKSGRYLGAINAATTAPDAPLLATRSNGRITIWRLSL